MEAVDDGLAVGEQVVTGSQISRTHIAAVTLDARALLRRQFLQTGFGREAVATGSNGQDAIMDAPGRVAISTADLVYQPVTSYREGRSQGEVKEPKKKSRRGFASMDPEQRRRFHPEVR